jgi:hypothetical protein
VDREFSNRMLLYEVKIILNNSRPGCQFCEPNKGLKTVHKICTANHLTRTSACKKNSKHPDTITNPTAHAGGPFARNATYRAVISLKSWSEDLEKSEACSFRL